MGGVDLTDQHVTYYSLTTRKTIKWWKKVFWHLVNCWIIYKINQPNSKVKTQKYFMKTWLKSCLAPPDITIITTLLQAKGRNLANLPDI